MEKQQPLIGLALGSGGVRGFAHIGVIKTLLKHEIPIHFVAGSSMGALVGAMYGAGHSIENMEKMAVMFRRKFYIDFTVPKMGLITGKRLKELIYMLSKQKNIEDLKVPVHIVATDLKSGERVVFKKGPVADAVRASISIPGIFIPEKIDGRLLVDGGVIDRVPASVVKEMGADLTIAVDVSFYERETEISSIYDVIMQSMEIMGRQLLQYREIEADIMIRPITKYYNSIVFEEVNELIALGEKAAEGQIHHIKEMLTKWREKNNGI
ncbi:patatin-like phospholipase family protein [Thalassorhabdus alkalitolerans]|uniref:Patatin-like phospholipase family protein n=1 Tax=Thalassorhabdus alkalitolerans TaxID=2282697 RepID=A0ABW0YPI6_9BACI